jgi:hypothetical protein
MAGPSQPQLHHGDKTLTTAQDLGVVTMLLQHGYRFRNGLGSQIFESWRYHGSTSFNIKLSIAKKASNAIHRKATLISYRPRTRETAQPEDNGAVLKNCTIGSISV